MSVLAESCKRSYLYKVSLFVWTLWASLMSFSSPLALDVDAGEQYLPRSVLQLLPYGCTEMAL